MSEEPLRLSKEDAERIAEALNYRHSDGTVLAVLQHYKTREVLMVGSMNKEAVIRTLTTGLVHFWSLSRKRLWLKGETSGHYHYVMDVYVDCDNDALLLLVKPLGPTCHTGSRTCFFKGVRDLLK